MFVAAFPEAVKGGRKQAVQWPTQNECLMALLDIFSKSVFFLQPAGIIEENMEVKCIISLSTWQLTNFLLCEALGVRRAEK